MSDADPEAGRAALGRLRRMGGEELVRDMLGIFLADTPDRIAAARAAFRAGDAEEIARVTHALKSSCGQLGATAMQRLAEQTEMTARASDLAPTPELLDELERELNSYQLWLDRTGAGAFGDGS